MSAGFGDTGLKSRCARSLRSWTGRGTNKLGNGGGRQTLAEVEDDERVEASRGRVVRGGKKAEEAAGRFGIGKNQRQRSAQRNAAQMDGGTDGWMAAKYLQIRRRFAKMSGTGGGLCPRAAAKDRGGGRFLRVSKELVSLSCLVWIQRRRVYRW